MNKGKTIAFWGTFIIIVGLLTYILVYVLDYYGISLKDYYIIFIIYAFLLLAVLFATFKFVGTVDNQNNANINYISDNHNIDGVDNQNNESSDYISSDKLNIDGVDNQNNESSDNISDNLNIDGVDNQNNESSDYISSDKLNIDGVYDVNLMNKNMINDDNLIGNSTSSDTNIDDISIDTTNPIDNNTTSDKINITNSENPDIDSYVVIDRDGNKTNFITEDKNTVNPSINPSIGPLSPLELSTKIDTGGILTNSLSAMRDLDNDSNRGNMSASTHASKSVKTVNSENVLQNSNKSDNTVEMNILSDYTKDNLQNSEGNNRKSIDIPPNTDNKITDIDNAKESQNQLGGDQSVENVNQQPVQNNNQQPVENVNQQPVQNNNQPVDPFAQTGAISLLTLAAALWIIGSSNK